MTTIERTGSLHYTGLPALVEATPKSTKGRATYGSPYTKRRAPSPRSATITISDLPPPSVSGITVNNIQIIGMQPPADDQ